MKIKITPNKISQIFKISPDSLTLFYNIKTKNIYKKWVSN